MTNNAFQLNNNNNDHTIIQCNLKENLKTPELDNWPFSCASIILHRCSTTHDLRTCPSCEFSGTLDLYFPVDFYVSLASIWFLCNRLYSDPNVLFRAVSFLRARPLITNRPPASNFRVYTCHSLPFLSPFRIASVYWVFPSIVFVLAEQPGGLFHRGSSIFILRTVSCLQSPQSKAFFSSFSSGFVLLSFHFPCVEFSIRSLMFTLSRLFGYNFFSCFFSLFLSLFFFVFENRWRDPISSTEIDVSFPKFISTEA